MKISPLVGFSIKLMVLSKVDLPDPDGPMITLTLPSSKSIEQSFNAKVLSSNRLDRCFISMILFGIALLQSPLKV